MDQELSFRDVDSYINQIICGGKIYEITNKSGEKVLLFFKHPFSRDLVGAEFIRLEALERARQEGLMTLPEMEELLVSRGLWSKDKDVEISKLEDQLKGQRAILSKTTKVLANRERLKNIIKDLESKIWEIRREKEYRLEHTRERRAEEDRFIFLTWCGTYSMFGEERYWPTLRDFRQDPDFLFRRKVTIDYSIFSIGIPINIIRYIARSSQWKLRYIACQKHGGRLFSRDVSDYSVDMLNLMYWSSFYSSLNEMMPEDKPADSIIEDDEALDAYMDEYFKEQSRKSADSKSKKLVGGSASAWDHQETLVTRSNPIYQDIQYSETIAEKLRKKGSSVTTVSIEDLNKKK